MPRDPLASSALRTRTKGQGLSHEDAVRTINETLRGPVAEIFRAMVPAFRSVSGPEFYDTVMGSSELLHGCIRIFRRHPDMFRTLLVDRRGRPVNDEFVALKCGRSVHEIIAMMVRTHAKRHFRKALGGDPNDPNSRSGRLYQAMSEYLIHDWQVPLVPHYAPLPMIKVLEMGPRILDIREAELLDAIAAAAHSPVVPVSEVPAPARPQTPPPLPPVYEEWSPTQPAVAPQGPKRHSVSFQDFSGTPQEEFWWQALSDKMVTAVLGPLSGHELREVVGALAGVNDAVRSELFAGLSLSTNQAAVCLATAHRVMGRQGFASLFGNPGRPQQVSRMADQMRMRKVNSRTELKALVSMTESLARV